MPLIISDTGGGQKGPNIYAPAGLHSAICVDVVDLGEKETPWGKKPKLSVRFLIDKEIPSGTWNDPNTSEPVDVSEKLAGKPFMVMRQFTRSIHEKSALRAFLKQWRGKDLSKEEGANFDVEGLIGACCAINVQHNQSEDGRWWANIGAIMELPKGMKAIEAGDYVRMQDRGQQKTNDDIPF